MQQIQMFGSAGSKATRKAQRWFSERRIPVTYVDVRKRPPAPGELKRFVQRFGVEAVLDPDAKAYKDQALQYVSASDDDWITRMAAEPAILRLPLLRLGNDLAVGDDEPAWALLAEKVKG